LKVWLEMLRERSLRTYPAGSSHGLPERRRRKGLPPGLEGTLVRPDPLGSGCATLAHDQACLGFRICRRIPRDGRMATAAPRAAASFGGIDTLAPPRANPLIRVWRKERNNR
jgi:hypothetical protein